MKNVKTMDDGQRRLTMDAKWWQKVNCTLAWWVKHLKCCHYCTVKSVFPFRESCEMESLNCYEIICFNFLSLFIARYNVVHYQFTKVKAAINNALHSWKNHQIKNKHGWINTTFLTILPYCIIKLTTMSNIIVSFSY